MFGFIRRKVVYHKIDTLIDMLNERLDFAFDVEIEDAKDRAEFLEAVNKINGAIYYLRLLRSKI